MASVLQARSGLQETEMRPAALAAKARHVLARDTDLTDLQKPFGVEIVTPRQFLSRLPRPIRRELG